MSSSGPRGIGLAQPAYPPVGNSFTTTAATGVNLGAETGAPPSSLFGCLGVWVKNPLVTDAGANQVDSILVGWANQNVANLVGNVKYPISLAPGEEKFIECPSLNVLWIKPASNTPIAKYYTVRGDIR